MLKQDPRVLQIQAASVMYPNFPKPGINFVDIFPMVANQKVLNLVTDIFVQRLQNENIQYDKICMLQSRGFLFGVPLSQRTGKPCIPIRKKGKLPGQCVSIGYGLQYGKDEIQIQKVNLNKEQKVVLVDDVLATGGTLNAAISLIQKCGGEVVQILLINRVKGLNGEKNINLPEDKIFYMYDI